MATRMFDKDRKTRDKKIHETWMSIQECIGSASNWPKYTRSLFWKTTHMTHFERILLVDNTCTYQWHSIMVFHGVDRAPTSDK